MEATSELILRHLAEVPSGALMVTPPNDELLSKLPPGRFVTLNYGHWQQLRSRDGWEGQFGLVASDPVDFAIVWMPKARKEFELLMTWTLSQLNPGARLWLVGEKKGGTESSGKALQKTLGCGSKRDSARHCQLWEYVTKTTGKAFSLDDWMYRRSAQVPVGSEQQEIVLVDVPGVFSQGRLDEGTALLLASLDEMPKGPVLDFACGGGVIGTALMARWGALQINFIDIQWQALLATEQTLLANGLIGEVSPSDGLAGLSGKFGTIVSNPPFHSGLKTDLEIVRQFVARVRAHLLPGGVLWLVANAFLPYQQLLEDQFGTVEVASDNRRFRVYRASLQKVR
ncbi:methyltransferase [Hydrocarboniclastica marina]|uniref:Ribosomal RNA small subunit methyltransferase C n=1 Tax=Hydrocarboniclastica marina TaxID=2259620 RepID=A0A4P7XF58_9ALTE|nr:methyltransferase [Hydrocarboniclastica marina]QCF25558.1 hypothetical protein soil367_06270 [Hydrocarboniclastica marina]